MFYTSLSFSYWFFGSFVISSFGGTVALGALVSATLLFQPWLANLYSSLPSFTAFPWKEGNCKQTSC